jgi:hypothetical protein
MFDDQIKKQQASAPSNLPVSDPEDMFSATDDVAPAESRQTIPEQPPVVGAKSALDVGVLKPANSQQPPRFPQQNVLQPAVNSPQSANRISFESPTISASIPKNPVAEEPKQEYAITEPAMSRSILAILIVVAVVAIVGGGGWLLYVTFIRGDIPDQQTANLDQLDLKEEAVDMTDLLPSDNSEAGALTAEEQIKTDLINNDLLFGEQVDSDDDGIDDLKEGELGTDPKHWDTDGDTLSDGEEILIYKTNPLDPDTDKDTYNDGIEIKAGYNPLGTGRLLELPAQESQ